MAALANHPCFEACFASHEIRLFPFVARGFSSKRIGKQLGLTEGTVKIYLHSVYDKLGMSTDPDVSPRTALIALLLRQCGQLPEYEEFGTLP